MLVHIQKPFAKYVLPAGKWKEKYDRTIKPAAVPIVMLQPMGPVMFVFDVSDTEGDDNLLPKEVFNPFAVRSGIVGKQLPMTIRNAVRDGIRVSYMRHGAR